MSSPRDLTVPRWEAYDPYGPATAAVQDARTIDAREAADRFAAAADVPATDVRVSKRHIEVFTLAQHWATARRAGLPHDDGTSQDGPPAGWTPPEGQPSWRFVSRAHPAGRPMWICGLRSDRVPKCP
ncbi:hypothetical protein AB0L40_09340 [Patulibacter sp. NPDC049589]|uniref:hypothetical protein n=1 Tax=Patulibacter sp. NPDC049589 TaxID=3154731 RepID=UPI003418A23B